MLQKFFFTDWRSQNVETSLYIGNDGMVTTQDGCYCCQLETHVNVDVNLTTVARIEIGDVERRCLCSCGIRISVQNLVSPMFCVFLYR